MLGDERGFSDSRKFLKGTEMDFRVTVRELLRLYVPKEMQP